jgi:hypothetical protein
MRSRTAGFEEIATMADGLDSDDEVDKGIALLGLIAKETIDLLGQYLSSILFSKRKFIQDFEKGCRERDVKRRN